MNLCIIGYGKMGREIEKIAIERGHKIVDIIDLNQSEKLDSDNLKKCDVAIEFTTPDSAEENYKKCLQNGVSVVSGTTGWSLEMDVFADLCKKNKAAFFYAPNFSIGVNIFFAINRRLAKLMSEFKDYKADVEETHHIHKLDKPSGTAIEIANNIISNNSKYKAWELGKTTEDDVISVQAFREHDIFGIHSVKWENHTDYIKIEHNAKCRKGFALGAVLAAEFIKDKCGIFTMNDLLNF